MATTSSTQQANAGNNTLIVSSSLIPFSSASQLSSVNSSLASAQQPLITQNQLGQQQPFLQVFPTQDAFQIPHLYHQQQMFLQPPSLTAVQQNSLQQALAASQQQHQLQADQLAKKKLNKQQKIISKSSTNQLQKATTANLPVLKSNILTGQPQFTTQNNQVVISHQLPNVISNSQALAANKKLLDAQKSKQQQIVSSLISDSF